MRDSSGPRRDTQELRVVSARLREIASAQARRSRELRDASAAVFTRAVLLKTVFVARRVEAGCTESPLDHPFFSPEFLPKDRTELLAVALQCAKRFAGTPLAALHLCGTEGALRIEAQFGLSPAFVRFFDGLSGHEFLRECGQVFIADVASDALLARTGSGAVLTDAGMLSLACTPIVHESGLEIGLLSTYYREPITAEAANLPAQRSVAARVAQWLEPVGQMASDAG
jgi:hypothetical protein